MLKKILTSAALAAIWLSIFYVSLVKGLPRDEIRLWISDQLSSRLKADVSIEEFGTGLDLEILLSGIVINSTPRPDQPGSGYSVRLTSIRIAPSLISLLRLNPVVDFDIQTPSGGKLNGSYRERSARFEFKGLNLTDISIPGLPAPSNTTADGDGRLKMGNGKGRIKLDIEGIPGGRQKLDIPPANTRGIEGEIGVRVKLTGL